MQRSFTAGAPEEGRVNKILKLGYRNPERSSLSARRRGRAPDRADAGGPEAPRRLVRGCARLI